MEKYIERLKLDLKKNYDFRKKTLLNKFLNTNKIKKSENKGDLLKYSKILRKRITEFNENINDEGLEELEVKFKTNSQNINQSLKHEVKDVSVFNTFLLTFISFLFLYFIIRFY